MDPCPFVRIVIGNLALKLPEKPHPSCPVFYCKLKLKGFPTQVSDVSVLASDSDAADGKILACFTLRKAELEKLAEKSSRFSCLKVKVYRRGRGGKSCGLGSGRKLLGCVVVQLDLTSFLENNGGQRRCVVQNGWVPVGGSGVELRLNVRAEPDPRFVFRFDGEPECSPQIFQVNGNVKQPVFSCKFSFRSSGERNLLSRSSVSEPSTSVRCFNSFTEEKGACTKERKGWSLTIHDLSGSPVAAASMVTPFVPSQGTDTVSRSNPGAWLILRPSNSTWKPWGRLEAWRQRNRIGYRFELIPEGGIDSIPLANSA